MENNPPEEKSLSGRCASLAENIMSDLVGKDVAKIIGSYIRLGPRDQLAHFLASSDTHCFPFIYRVYGYAGFIFKCARMRLEMKYLLSDDYDKRVDVMYTTQINMYFDHVLFDGGIENVTKIYKQSYDTQMELNFDKMYHAITNDWASPYYFYIVGDHPEQQILTAMSRF